MAKMTENSRKVFDFLKANFGKEFTAQEIAGSLGVSIPTVTGSVTGLAKKGYAVRNPKMVADGEKEKEVKFITLTAEGLEFDPDAQAE